MLKQKKRIVGEPSTKPKPIPSQTDLPDEGALFGLNTDHGDGQSTPPTVPNKGSFFGLHTDWGKSRDK